MSIVLDTNVISALDGPKYSERLLQWLNAFQREELFLTTVAVAEIRYGLSLLPEGRRRDSITQAYDRIEDGLPGE